MALHVAIRPSRFLVVKGQIGVVESFAGEHTAEKSEVEFDLRPVSTNLNVFLSRAFTSSFFQMYLLFL